MQMTKNIGSSGDLCVRCNIITVCVPRMSPLIVKDKGLMKAGSISVMFLPRTLCSVF